jgi:hypothetical protein
MSHRDGVGIGGRYRSPGSVGRRPEQPIMQLSRRLDPPMGTAACAKFVSRLGTWAINQPCYLGTALLYVKCKTNHPAGRSRWSRAPKLYEMMCRCKSVTFSRAFTVLLLNLKNSRCLPYLCKEHTWLHIVGIVLILCGRCTDRTCEQERYDSP